MALIKCLECGNEVSDKAPVCPRCGVEISKNPKEQPKNKQNSKEITKIIEKINIPNTITYFSISFILFLLIVLPLNYGLTIDKNYNVFELFCYELKDLFMPLFIYGTIIFVSFIMSIFSKRAGKFAKVGYLIALGILISISYQATQNNIRLTHIYSIMYALTSILIFLPNKTNLKQISVDADVEEITKIEENNTLKEEYHNKKISKREIIITILIFLSVLSIGVFTSIKFTNKNIKNNISLNELTSLKYLNKNEILYTKITNEYINVRKETSTTSKKVGEVIKDDIYQVIDIDKYSNIIWYKIKDKENNEGYIAGMLKSEWYVSLTKKQENIELSTIKNLTNEDNKEEPENNIDDNTDNNPPIPNNNLNNQSNNNNPNTNNNSNNQNNNNNTNNNSNKAVATTETTTTNDNNEQENLKKQYLKEVETENLRYENEVKKIKEEYYLYGLEAKDKMADAKYFASFYGGLYYGTKRDYEKEYQKLMESKKYEKADALAARWDYTVEYRKWEEYLNGLPQEEQNYLKRKQEAHNKIIEELKQKYNQ